MIKMIIFTYRNVGNFLNVEKTEIDQGNRSGKVENDAPPIGAVIRFQYRFLLVLDNQQVAKSFTVGYTKWMK